MSEVYYGFTETEIQEFSEFDEEWGHLKTSVHLDSMKSDELIKLIESDSSHQTFRQYTMSSQMVYCVIILAIVTLIMIVWVFDSNLDETGVLVMLFILFFYSLFFVCLYLSEWHSNSVITSPIGIGWKNFGTAIEWNHIEWIDIGMKKDKIERIIFSGNRRHLWHDNDRFYTEFTLAHLVTYLPDFESWNSVEMPGWPNRYRRYIRPKEDS